MKKIRKIFLCIILLCSCIYITTMQISYAKVASDFGLNIKSETSSNKYGVNYNHLDVSINGSTDKNVNFFSMKTDGVNSKLVTWAKTSATRDKIDNATLTSLASDYQKNHPGWIVVAGINADQWYYQHAGEDKGGWFHYGGQSYYPFTMDGQNLFTINPLGGRGNGIAITNNANNPIIGISNSQGIELQIYDKNDNLIYTYNVDGYNKTPGANQTMVWSGYVNSNNLFEPRKVESTNNLYIIGNAELSYMNNSREYPSGTIYYPVDSFYGRGEISAIESSATLKKAQFAIETTNNELKEKLAIGVKVIVEQQYVPDEANNVESVTGYHTQHISNGTVLPTTAPYNTKTYPRSIFGVTENGEYFLMSSRDCTSNSTGGTNYEETNALLKYFGAYNAFQDDGGGSVTAIYRNNSGSFDVVSESTDAAQQRSIFSALFFVVRDTGFTSNYVESTASSVTLNKKSSVFVSEMTDIKAIVNNKTININEDKTVISGLKENTEYEIKVQYKHNGVDYEAIMYASTKPYSPGIDINATHNSFKITRRQTDPVLKIISVTFDVNGEKYEMGDVDQFVIDDLYKDTKYQISYTYTVLNTETNQTYTRTKEAIEYSTLSYEIPSATEFEAEKNERRSRISVEYRISDVDGLMTKAYVLFNGVIYEISNTRGTLNFDGLDFTKTYKVQLVIEYTLPSGIEKTTSTEEILFEPHVHTWSEATCTDPQKCTGCGEEQGAPLGHSMTSATCTEGSKCSICGTPNGSSLGHNWQDATEEAPKTCLRCGATEGSPLEKEEPKKGCKKSAISTIVFSMSILVCSLYLVKRKK